MTQNKPHRWAKEIIAWAQGITIQQRSEGENEWRDCVNPLSNTPYFGTTWSEFRIKPPSIKVRIAVFRSDDGFVWFSTCTDSPNEERQAKIYESRKDFAEWMTDWIEYEVPSQ